MKKFNERKNWSMPEVGAEVLRWWDDEDVFARSIAEREGAPSFVFYEGPPSANGQPGIHHVMGRTIKDVICRYKTMLGYQVRRKAGWDTHGLPVELGVEKELGITKEDIGRTISVDDYNAACRRAVMKYTNEWTELTRRMGYWVDLDNPYITYKNSYIETLWWLLKQLFDKGLLYKGYTIQPYSPAAGTGLSSHELNMPGCYRDVKDQTATAQFSVIADEHPVVKQILAAAEPRFKDIKVLAWTTTPWTLPSNTALCVGPKIDYVAVESFNPYTGAPATYIIAEALVASYFKAGGDKQPLEYSGGGKLMPWRVVARFTGADMLGLRYEQLFPWVKPVEKLDDGSIVSREDRAFRVIPGDYVTTDDGTGIVHIAPTFGADDAAVARAAGVPALFIVNRRGETRPMVDFTGKYFKEEDIDPDFLSRFVNMELYGEYAGRYVKNAYDPKYTVNNVYNEKAANEDEDLNIYICIRMKQAGTAFRLEKHIHNYPHCWRTDKPILYYPLDSWFIRSTACRDRMVELNRSIRWKPEHTGTGRFGKWLENLNDWNLSRSRYWGTPLPIWRSEDDELKCIGSIAELYAEIDKAVEAGVMSSNPYRDRGFVPGDYSDANYDRIDLHRPYVDDIVLVSDSGKPMHRETDLIDVWFDSGAMPYAQLHYPFENADAVDRGTFFADFIAEGVDQTRGWFFTLHAIATMVSDSIAFRSVISNGLVLDRNGEKMSKRKGNSVDPFEAIDKHGIDPLRWYMVSNTVPWENLKYDDLGVNEVINKFFGTLQNTYSFFTLYANVDGFEPDGANVPVAERPEIDRWIISKLNSLIVEVRNDLDNYETTRAARAISEFVGDHLSNWYVRLNRRRYWAGEMNDDKRAAYLTLHECLVKVALLIAPISPFYADMLYRDLNRDMRHSVHLAKYPEADTALIDAELEARMDMAQSLTSMVLALRRKSNLKVRQPLHAIMVPVMSDEQRTRLEAIAELVKTEVNVKQVTLVDGDSGVLVKRVKPDFKKLGPKFGKLMKGVAAALTTMEQSDIATLERTGSVTLTVAGESVTVDIVDVDVYSEDIPGWLVSTDGNLTVALDITVTDELKREGIARELVNRIQNLRKSTNLEITDKIELVLNADERINDVIEQYGEMIAGQVLATSITVGTVSAKDAGAAVLDMNDWKLPVVMTRSGQ